MDPELLALFREALKSGRWTSTYGCAYDVAWAWLRPGEAEDVRVLFARELLAHAQLAGWALE
jgi:hypothetical protein